MQGTDNASPVLIGEAGLIATRLGVGLPHLVPHGLQAAVGSAIQDNPEFSVSHRAG